MYSMPGKPKLSNIRDRPRVSFHLNSDELGEKWAVIVGTARVNENLPPFTDIPAFIDKYRDALDHWGFDPKALAGAYSVGVRIEPSLVRIRIR
jgi:PPOX class probable F420-dependent enzyme